MAVGTIYVDTGGATTNSGTTDTNGATLSGTGDAVATGSVVQLTIGTDLSGIAADGSQAIYLAQATNSNRKIFWITAKDDALDQVTVDVAPTGVTASNWAIGGRLVWTPANIESALRAGDTVQFNNTPATRTTTTFFTARNAGDSTTGRINIIGKTGVRPVLENTGSAVGLTMASVAGYYISNLEIKTAGGAGTGIQNVGSTIIDNVKISGAGGTGIVVSGQGVHVLSSEITGVGGAGITSAANYQGAFIGNYIHGVGANAIEISGNSPCVVIANNVITGNTGKGILWSGAPTSQATYFAVINNTVYGNGDSGLEIADADAVVILYNNIFQENGNAANEYNVEWTAGNAERVALHKYNLFYHSNCQGSGTGGPSCVSGLTVNSTESSSDALFTNAGSSDFTLQSTSPAKATAYPGVFLGGNTGYLDMGALQRQEPSGSGGGLRLAGKGGLAAGA